MGRLELERLGTTLTLILIRPESPDPFNTGLDAMNFDFLAQPPPGQQPPQQYYF